MVLEPEVDESGAGNLYRRQARYRRQRGLDALGNLARLAARGLGQLQGDVGREVPVVALARAGQVHRDAVIRGQGAVKHQLGERRLQRLGEDVFQGR
jgi:hypothetical protein